MHIPFNCLETIYFITFKEKVNRIWYKSGQTHSIYGLKSLYTVYVSLYDKHGQRKVWVFIEG